MVRVYSEEIDKLKMELRDLREHSLLSESSMRELKDITLKQNVESEVVEGSKVSELVEDSDPLLSKVSSNTLAWSVQAHM